MMGVAERQRRYRRRQRDGIQVVPVEVPDDIVSAMVAAGLVTETDCDDNGCISRAIVQQLRYALLPKPAK